VTTIKKHSMSTIRFEDILLKLQNVSILNEGT
jgi:hypothetical protein